MKFSRQHECYPPLDMDSPATDVGVHLRLSHSDPGEGCTSRCEHFQWQFETHKMPALRESALLLQTSPHISICMNGLQSPNLTRGSPHVKDIHCVAPKAAPSLPLTVVPVSKQSF